VRVMSGTIIVCLVLMLASGLASAQTTKGRSRFDGATPVNRVIPEYPPLARTACVQGIVSVLVSFDDTGTVSSAEVIFGPPLLQPVALAAAKQWRFEAVPETQRRQVVQFNFTLVSSKALRRRGKPAVSESTKVDVRAPPAEITCNDCDERGRKRAQTEWERQCAGG